MICLGSSLSASHPKEAAVAVLRSTLVANYAESNDSRENLIDAASDAIRQHQTGVDAVDEAAAALLGIIAAICSVWMFSSARAGDRRRASCELRVTTGAVTALLDRLERGGYVERVRDGADRRRIFVRLTDEARRRAWEVYGPIADDAELIFRPARCKRVSAMTSWTCLSMKAFNVPSTVASIRSSQCDGSPAVAMER